MTYERKNESGVHGNGVSDRIPFASGHVAENEIPDHRSCPDRRRVVKTKFLFCGKIMDLRKTIRRSADRLNEQEIERERTKNLGPGWL